jgi:hypothetical protein
MNKMSDIRERLYEDGVKLANNKNGAKESERIISKAPISSIMKNKTYIDFIQGLAEKDCVKLREKDREYRGSWKQRGGVGAFMMLARKWDRLEPQAKRLGWDVFEAIRQDRRSDGIIDDIRDLRRYLLLVEAEMVAQRVFKEPKCKSRAKASPRPQKPLKRKPRNAFPIMDEDDVREQDGKLRTKMKMQASTEGSF